MLLGMAREVALETCKCESLCDLFLVGLRSAATSHAGGCASVGSVWIDMSMSEGNSSESSARRLSGVRFARIVFAIGLAEADAAEAKDVDGSLKYAALKGCIGSPTGSNSKVFGAIFEVDAAAEGWLDLRSTMPTVAWGCAAEFFPCSFCFFWDSKSFASWLS